MSTIDLDADPFVPEGSTVKEHLKGGMFLFTLENMRVIHLKRNWSGKYNPKFHANLFSRLRNEKPINANLLDHLLGNPHLIPEKAKPECLYFWGTIYQLDGHRTLCVRYLRWDQEKKEWCWRWYGGCQSAWGDELTIPLLLK